MSHKIILWAAVALASANPALAQQTPKFGKAGGIGSATSTYPVGGGEPTGGTYSINGTTGIATLGGIVLPAQPATSVLAAPSASTGTPTFRVLLPADLPAVNLASSANGGAIGTLTIAKGGTGATAAGGTALDNVSGFTGTGFVKRNGTASYSIGSIGNVDLAPVAALTVKGNASGSTALPSDLTGAQVYGILPAACRNILAYGGIPNNSAIDNSAAFASAVAANSGRSPCVYLPAGDWYLANPALVSLSASLSTATVMIRGDGQEATRLIQTGVNQTGIAIVLTALGQSFHIRDLSVLAGNAGGTSVGILVQQATTGQPNSAQSDISSVTVRGSDGYAQTNYWNYGIFLDRTSNVNVISSSVFGPAGSGGFSAAGTCMAVNGTASMVPVQISIIATQLNYCGVGFNYGNYVQGVFVSGGSNFVGDNIGILQGGGQSGNDELTVIGSQFACKAYDIYTLSPIDGVTISGNFFYTPATNGIAINFGVIDSFTLTGNAFTTISTNNVAIVVGTSAYGVITGNQFRNAFVTAINLQSASHNVNVQSNSYDTAITNTVLNPGGTTNGNKVGGGSQ